MNNCGNNPCRVTQTNTAACESLPSQISNFSDQFFGLVVKTEVDGVVTWTLPCSLDVGLPNNPRAAGEGLACYFLRMFLDGIIGLTGPQGEPGANGANGANAFTVTLQSFAQPTLAAPNIQVLTAFNPAILPGLNVFIATSGWYVVDNADSSGALFLTLTQALPGAPAVITAGKLVVPAGVPGQSITGPQGPQGTVGPQGPPGNTFTSTNGFYFSDIGVNYGLQVVYTPVTFVNSAPQILLPESGRYLITAVIDVRGEGPVSFSDLASVKLRDFDIGADLPGSEHEISGLQNTERNNITIQSVYDTIGPAQIALLGKCTTANAISIVAARTTISFVRLE